MPSNERFLWFLVTIQRLSTLFLSAIIRYLVSDYDTSGIQSNLSSRPLDAIVFKLFGGLTQWDAIYYLKIAESGYSHQQFYAFLPGYPFILLIGGRTLAIFLNGVLSERACLVLAGVLLQWIFFQLAVLFFFRLTSLHFNAYLSRSSTVLFVFNPAAIFFTSLYTESLFAFFTFAGLYYLSSASPWIGTALLALSTLCRANGVINVGFLWFPFVYSFPWIRNLFPAYGSRLAQLSLPWLLFYSALVVSPFLAFQLYGYCHYCPGEPWCQRAVPLLYSHVQATYWNQGFLNYYQLKQLPNFLLALPVTLLSLYGITLTLKRPQGVAVYAVHCLALLLFGLTTMHVQVLTRFLSATSPILFWWAAEIVSEPGKARNLILIFFGTYWIVGTVLHSTFYPWT